MTALGMARYLLRRGDSPTGTGRSAICSGPCNNAPFDQGWNDGAGNPPNPNGLKTDYLWKRILTRDGLTDILENYAQVVETKDEKTGKKKEEGADLAALPPTRCGATAAG